MWRHRSLRGVAGKAVDGLRWRVAHRASWLVVVEYGYEVERRDRPPLVGTDVEEIVIEGRREFGEVEPILEFEVRRVLEGRGGGADEVLSILAGKRVRARPSRTRIHSVAIVRAELIVSPGSRIRAQGPDGVVAEVAHGARRGDTPSGRPPKPAGDTRWLWREG